ncbi:MAG: FAD:protein FMN transferase [Bacteroidota bacterium]
MKWIQLALFTWLTIFWMGCTPTDPKPYYKMTGETMGTYYAVSYQSTRMPSDMKSAVDSLLIQINGEVNTYDPNSTISRVNASSEGEFSLDKFEHFKTNMDRAMYWYEQSEGYLDVSLMPLVNYWGFGYTPKKAVTSRDQQQVDSLKAFVGLDMWTYDTDQNIITKQAAGQQLDFSSIAKGYAVDQVGELLESFGTTNYLVDIGGESTARGIKQNGSIWRMGINRPDPKAELDDIVLILELKDASLATSGNYRNYHEVNGQKYGHTIDPFSGIPYQDSLLSVSVITNECIDADGIATACMAMGYDKASTFIESLDDVTACYIIGRADGSLATIFADGFIRYAVQSESDSL